MDDKMRALAEMITVSGKPIGDSRANLVADAAEFVEPLIDGTGTSCRIVNRACEPL